MPSDHFPESRQQGESADPARVKTPRPRVPAHKPTERHLNAIMRAYRAQYESRGHAGVAAVAELVKREGVHVAHGRITSLLYEHLAPLADDLVPHVELAARLGASRLKQLHDKPAMVDRVVGTIVARVRSDRERWLLKTARDFVPRVLVPTLAKHYPTSEPMAAAAEDESFAAASWDVGPFVVTDDMLDALVKMAQRFITVRAVEATESDVWKGDDLGFINGAELVGISVFEWRVSPDDLVCPICSDFDGNEYSASESASISLDRGIVSHCRCRCWFDAVDSGPATPASYALLASTRVLTYRGVA